MPELLTYAKFHTDEELATVTAILDKASIAYHVEKEKNLLDKIYVGESYDPMIALKIANTDFITVNTLMVNSVEIDVDSINKDYYLFHFSVAELTSVLEHPYDWNYFDQALAKYLLAQQQVAAPVTTTEIAYEPIGLGIQWLILEYLLSVVMVYAGIIIGGLTLIAYKTLPNGKKVAIYNDKVRTHGKWMIVIGVLRFVYHYFF
jgi:hypothetical protein